MFKGQKESVTGSRPLGKGAACARVVRQGHLAWVCMAYIKVLTQHHSLFTDCLLQCQATDWALFFLHNTSIEAGIIISILQMRKWTQRGQVHVIR